MTKQFFNKVFILGSVDTRNYRYIVKACGDHAGIFRIPLSDLDTAAAIDGWEKVAEIR